MVNVALLCCYRSIEVCSFLDMNHYIIFSSGPSWLYTAIYHDGNIHDDIFRLVKMKKLE